MSEKDAYIHHLENTIKDLQNQVSNLTEMVLLLHKEKFDPSSEKATVQIEGQLSLFNKAEQEADPKFRSLHAFAMVRDEIQYIPAQIKIIRYMQQACECPACKHSDHLYIYKAAVPKSLMNHSLASAGSVAHVMYQKYVNAVPLCR